MTYRRISTIRTPSDFQAYLNALGLDLGFDEQIDTRPDAALAQTYRLRDGFTIGNRFSVLAMEGWDGTTDGRPTDFTRRRWRRFGLSGAKLIWGGEATAVRPDGRANPSQLMITETTAAGIASLREALVEEHEAHFGTSDDLLIGLQLTHSGRFAKPTCWKRMEPKILYHHPILDAKFGISPDAPVMTDDEISELVEDFVSAARLAQQAGLHFVDVKHCHGYLGHEFLSAIDRPGRYGGSFENRTRFLREVVGGIRSTAPGLQIGVRLSAFDLVPFRTGPNGVGEPVSLNSREYRYAFGSDSTGLGLDLAEPMAFMDLLAELDIELVCITGGSPYYSHHIQRPALFPPSDGYQPPEDPLVGVHRQIDVAARLKRHRPELCIVGSAYSYLQEWLPNVAQHVVRTGMADFVGLGRMVLPYPDIVSDILAGRPLQRKRICRTISDCTTAPRAGLISGCYPLDDFYRTLPQAETLAELKKKRK
ncbi:MAG: NADH:flavin oxidoreductase [Anaerolineae bacterium]|nr:NADH:flavin oxidoreductase [Anaerolineae bacterium]